MADNTSPQTMRALQLIPTTTPALYTARNAGFTFAYSHVVIPPLMAHAPPILMAKQWLQAYQFAPIIVAPLVLFATFSNAALAYLTPLSPAPRGPTRMLYVIAAVASASIVPYTALYMEPGINGAGKWKAEKLLRDGDGKGDEAGSGRFVLQGKGAGTSRVSASDDTKRWAEEVDMETIVQTWKRINAWRYVVTGIAMLSSGAAMVIG